jgi:hypothetical protein
MLKTLVLFAATFGAVSARADLISFTPATQTINVGGTATIDVQVSGLAAGKAVGSFDLTVLSNSSIVTPLSVLFLGSLGVPADEITGSDLSVAGAVNAFEVSLEDTATLLGLQSSQPFSLFRISYQGIAVGSTILTLKSTPRVVSDGDGTIIPFTNTATATINVVGSTDTVPEPSSWILLASMLVFAGFVMHRRRAIS